MMRKIDLAKIGTVLENIILIIPFVLIGIVLYDVIQLSIPLKVELSVINLFYLISILIALALLIRKISSAKQKRRYILWLVDYILFICSVTIPIIMLLLRQSHKFVDEKVLDIITLSCLPLYILSLLGALVLIVMSIFSRTEKDR